jgi:hypothetical protein
MMVDNAGFPIKKTFLYALIGSVVLSAILGIGAIFSGRFDWIQVRILLTTVTISVASICGLGCGAYFATGRGRLLPLAGIALALLAAVMVIGGMWIELGNQRYWRFAASISVFAVACAHLSLLSMAKMASSYRWSLPAAYIAIFGVAVIIVSMIIREPHDAGMFQLLGVAAILDAAITVVIPIFHRLSRAEVGVENERPPRLSTAEIDAEIAKLQIRLAELEGMKRE